MLKAKAMNLQDSEILIKDGKIGMSQLAALCWTLAIASVALQTWSIYLCATTIR
jgi:hypothetical protein